LDKGSRILHILAESFPLTPLLFNILNMCSPSIPFYGNNPWRDKMLFNIMNKYSII